ncbi:hypothetical protein GW943_03105 [Candidatus Parcubacteria bacterium]|uniref:Uncharacterized protein n=1 Tax=Candidatus Kaiserbacteria bacterium CG10_big_fil_rev_8_21_14_0_10_47_16 TaxID=1974608 RepID=A0A2H0UET5_9BACT|nr:hypothetical protein [Candidatus Parcubacteria bacterium]PIR84870.1 MAG: hypothetical protein COU16_00585 [Candidatus Kaiserbacteria bacterium CG10_big_fil_rev_8_21_14_0_10_47_16]
MKYILIIAGILLLGGAFFIYSNSKSDDDAAIDNASYTTFTDTEAGLTFEYKTDPDGYVVDDLSAFIGADDTSVLKVFRVINKREKVELENSEGGREGPPIITVMVFKNEMKLTASQWVDSETRFSNIQAALGEVDRDAVVGGANAVRYRSDGLYQNDNAVVAHGTYIYHFTGAFLEEDSVIHKDFKSLIDSVTFIPTDTMSAKIDPRVACESALAYMTFENGDAADAFVAACINGEHPEVIERYIKDMGLDGAAI